MLGAALAAEPDGVTEAAPEAVGASEGFPATGPVVATAAADGEAEPADGEGPAWHPVTVRTVAARPSTTLRGLIILMELILS
jgi:hypothetical protein